MDFSSGGVAGEARSVSWRLLPCVACRRSLADRSARGCPAQQEQSAMIASSVPPKRCSPRSPWYQARTRTTGRPISEREEWRSAVSAAGQWKALAEEVEALQEPPGAGNVDEAPLDDLAAAQSGPDVRGVSRSRCRVVSY